MLVRRGRQPSGSPDVKLLDFGLAARTAVARPQALDASLTATIAPSMVATRPPTRDGVERRSAAPCSTWRRSSSTATRAITAPTSSRSAACSTRCSPDARRSRAPRAVTVIAAIMSSEPPPIAALAVGASAARPRAEALPREGSRAALAEHRRCHRRAALDCRSSDRGAGRRRAAAATEPRRPAGDGARARPRGGRRGRGRARPARTGRRAGSSRAPLRDLHGADRRSVDGAVGGRHADRVRREPGSRARALGPLARRRREPRAAWHRRRQLSVLVAGRPHPRVLRRRQAEANRRRRWNAAGRSPTRRTAAAARGTPTASILFAPGVSRSDHARLGARRSGGARDAAERRQRLRLIACRSSCPTANDSCSRRRSAPRRPTASISARSTRRRRCAWCRATPAAASPRPTSC